MPIRRISLTTEHDAFVEQIVRSGEFQNASEVICDALRVLQRQRQDEATRLNALRTQVRAGAEALERGEFAEVEEADLDSYLDGLMLVSDKGRAEPVARFLLSPLARADLARILATSAEQWGGRFKRATTRAPYKEARHRFV